MGLQHSRDFTHNPEKYDAVILAVAHSAFEKLNVRNLINKRSVVYDVKGFWHLMTLMDDYNMYNTHLSYR